MTPARVQLRRTKGWRLPPGTIVVARPTQYGNPFRVARIGAPPEWAVTHGRDVWIPEENTKASAADLAVRVYRGNLLGFWNAYVRERIATSLRGHDLACWCPLDAPCHADVLLEVANRPTPTTATPDPRSTQ